MLMVIMIINNNSTSFSIYQSVHKPHQQNVYYHFGKQYHSFIGSHISIYQSVHKPHQQNVYYQVYIISENNIIVLSVVIFAKIKFHFAVVFFILIEYLLPACSLKSKQFLIRKYISNKIHDES